MGERAGAKTKKEEPRRVDDALCCPMCREEYSAGNRIAKLLPTCFHTMCSECCGKLNPTKCPLDRADFNMPEGGAEELVTNYALMAAVGVTADAEETKHQDDESVLCSLCEENASTSRCIQCQGDPYCDSCWKIHKKQRSSKTHKSGPLDTVVPPKAMCTVHPQHELKYFCVDDEELFCMSCFPTSVHRTHNSVDVDKAIDILNDHTVQEKAALMQTKLQQMIQQNAQATEGIKAQYKDLSRSISLYYQQVMAAVKAQEQKVQASLSALRNTKTKLLEAQHDQLTVQAQSLATLSKQLVYMNQVGGHAHAVQFALQMRPLLAQDPGDGPADGPSLCFSMDDNLIDTVKKSGAVSDDAPDAKLCTVEGVTKASWPGNVAVENTFTIHAVTAKGTPKTAGGDIFSIRTDHCHQQQQQKDGEPLGGIIPHRIKDVGDGSYVVRYTVPEDVAADATADSIQVNISFRGVPLNGSPYKIPLYPEGTRLRSAAIWAAVRRMLPAQCKTSVKLLHTMQGAGNERTAFHAAVDGHKQILTIIKAKETNCVFGGFFMEQCGSTNGWVAGDKQNFVFSLGKGAAGPHVKLLNSRQPPGLTDFHSQACGVHIGLCSRHNTTHNSFRAFCNSLPQWSTSSEGSQFKAVAPGYQPLASSTISGVEGEFTPVIAEVYECS